MKLKIIVLISLFAFALVFSACSGIKVTNAGRHLVYPGVQNAAAYLQYEIAFKSKTDFSIKSVYIGDKTVSKYFIQNTASKVYEDVKNNRFKAGSYILSFQLNKTEVEISKKVKIILEVQGKPKTIITEVTEGEAVHKR